MLDMVVNYKQQRNEAIVLPIQKVSDFWTRFKCERCGKCCTDLPKGINISKSETERLARLKGINKVDFRRKFAKDGVIKYPCLFYDNGCSIYKVKPAVCSYFPLGRSVVRFQGFEYDKRNSQIYLTASPHCPGILTLLKTI